MTNEPATIPADLTRDTVRRRVPQSRSDTGAPSRGQPGHSAEFEIGGSVAGSASGRCASEVRILSQTAEFGTIRCRCCGNGCFLLSIGGGLSLLANSKSSKKRIRVAERRREENKPLRTEARTFVKKAEVAIASGDVGAAEAATLEAVSALDRVADKDVIHKNNAARRKSRLMAKYHALVAAST